MGYLAIVANTGWAQTSGNIGFGQTGTAGKAKAVQAERSRHVISEQDLPPSNTSMFVESNVLMNVKADEYVAVFGITREGATVQSTIERMDAAVNEFTAALKALKISENDIYADFITQPKIYGFEIVGDVAREKLSGFELKKNVSVRYTDRDLIDQLVAIAASLEIYDLIKVDYVVRDIGTVQAALMEAAAGVTKEKIARYEKLLGVRVQPAAQIYAERSGTHYPSELYDSYVAAETEGIAVPNTQRYTVQRARKGRTFFFNGLDGNGFDKVINPVVIEPVVQFTLYLKVKYEIVRE
jgi:uncharacterized protein YggE